MLAIFGEPEKSLKVVDVPHAKAAVAALPDEFGFAALDLGGLREGGRLMQLDGALSARHFLLQDSG